MPEKVNFGGNMLTLNEIAIGRERHAIAVWKKDYKTISKRHGKRAEHAKEVLDIVRAIEILMKRREKRVGEVM